MLNKRIILFLTSIFIVANSYAQVKVIENKNVGIGIDIPTSKLHIKSNNNTSSTNAVKIENAVGISLFHIEDGGKVGIGATNLTEKLTVAGSLSLVDYSSRIYLRRSTSVGGYIQGIQTQDMDGTNNIFFGAQGANSFVIKNGNHSGQDLLRITKDNTYLNHGSTFSSRVIIDELVDNTSSQETSNAPLYITSKMNAVSMFLGKYENVTSFGVNDASGNIRFNGAYVGWGDFGYYPNGGDADEYGHFRFSIAGSNIVSTPNAKLGVGNMYVHNKLQFQSFESNNLSSGVKLVASPDGPYYGYGIRIDPNHLGPYIRYLGSLTYGDTYVGSISILGQLANGKKMYFDISNNTTSNVSDDMVLKKVDEDAYLGIGTEDPTCHLDVKGNTKIEGSLKVDQDPSSTDISTFRVSRLTVSEVNSIISPENGMIIYLTSTGAFPFTAKGFYGYEEGSWVKL